MFVISCKNGHFREFNHGIEGSVRLFYRSAESISELKIQHCRHCAVCVCAVFYTIALVFGISAADGETVCIVECTDDGRWRDSMHRRMHRRSLGLSRFQVTIIFGMFWIIHLLPPYFQPLRVILSDYVPVRLFKSFRCWESGF